MDQPEIKGLPEGAAWSGDFFPAGPDDYELMNAQGSEPYIAKGVRHGAGSAVKVLPKPGYAFVHTGWEFDIRAYDKGREKFAVTKLLGQFVNDEKGVPQFVPQSKSTTATLKFTVANELDAAKLEDAIKHFAEIPGYVEMTRSDG